MNKMRIARMCAWMIGSAVPLVAGFAMADAMAPVPVPVPPAPAASSVVLADAPPWPDARFDAP